MEYSKASEKQSNKFLEEAENWYKQNLRFGNYAKIAIVAVAEYLANKEGVTTFLDETRSNDDIKSVSDNNAG